MHHTYHTYPIMPLYGYLERTLRRCSRGRRSHPTPLSVGLHLPYYAPIRLLYTYPTPLLARQKTELADNHTGVGAWFRQMGYWKCHIIIRVCHVIICVCIGDIGYAYPTPLLARQKTELADNHTDASQLVPPTRTASDAASVLSPPK